MERARLLMRAVAHRAISAVTEHTQSTRRATTARLLDLGNGRMGPWMGGQAAGWAIMDEWKDDDGWMMGGWLEERTYEHRSKREHAALWKGVPRTHRMWRQACWARKQSDEKGQLSPPVHFEA